MSNGSGVLFYLSFLLFLKGGVHKRLQDLAFFDHLSPFVYIFYGIKNYKKSICLTTYTPPVVNVVCERPQRGCFIVEAFFCCCCYCCNSKQTYDYYVVCMLYAITNGGRFYKFKNRHLEFKIQTRIFKIRVHKSW